MKPWTLLALCALSPGVQQVVVIIADDVGVDRIGAYGEHPRPGRTPNIDRLAARGLLFRNAWAYPVCSSARAAILTGRHGFRTGIGAIVRPPTATGVFNAGLPIDETTIADVLRPGLRTFAVGKWHLRDHFQSTSHPGQLGFDYYAGSLYNLAWELLGGNYFLWRKTVNGQQHDELLYATVDTADEAVGVLAFGGPSFVWVAFNAAHAPLHAPPSELHTYDLVGDPAETPIVHTKAMIEAMDNQIGRILDALDPDAYVFFIGDNGTWGGATDYPFIPEHSKSTLYEGGINVPFILAGPGVGTGECRALVQVTDVFATIAEIAHVSASTEDSISLVPYFQDPDRQSLRRWTYSEWFRPNGFGPFNNWKQAIRSERYKLIRRKHGSDELYDLEHDRFEQNDLLTAPLTDEQRRAYLSLVRNLPHQF